MDEFTEKFTPLKLDDATVGILELQSEMIDKGSEIFALYYDEIAGFELLARDLGEWKHRVAKEIQEHLGIRVDEQIWSTISPLRTFSPHGGDSPYEEFARSLLDYRMRLAAEGRNTFLAGNYLLIALYQFWEDVWRKRIAQALSIKDKNEIGSDFWGDLRLLRLCLIHRRGVADDNVQHKSVQFHWFKEGDQILIDRSKAELIISGFRGFVLGELHSYKKQAP